jgi:hypothetical protein
VLRFQPQFLPGLVRFPKEPVIEQINAPQVRGALTPIALQVRDRVMFGPWAPMALGMT